MIIGRGRRGCLDIPWKISLHLLCSPNAAIVIFAVEVVSQGFQRPEFCNFSLFSIHKNELLVMYSFPAFSFILRRSWKEGR